MPTLDFETDPFLTLLTDALRAGPGSAEWAEAVARLRAERYEGPRDEYQLLCAAREDLASGRRYREVRAGPGFTRRVFGAIESESSGTHRALPMANLIAIVSIATIVAILVLGGYLLWSGSGEEGIVPGRVGVTDLRRTYFVNAIGATRFDGAPGEGFKAFGTLPLSFTKKGLAPAASSNPASYLGGGVVWQGSIDPARPVELEASLLLPPAGQDVIVQAFVTDEARFDNDRATTPHELVFLLRDGQASVVLPDGRLAGDSLALGDSQRRVELKMMINQRAALIEIGGQELFNGEHGLDPQRPRQLGVRLLARGDKLGGAPAAVESLRILTPQSQ